VDMSYHVDRLFGAVSVLVTHGSVKQRLIRAYEENLADIDVVDLPIAVQESFAELRTLMHGVTPANVEGPVCASVRKMSEIQADGCARRIVEIYGEIATYAKADAEPMTVRPDEPQVVPPFLVKSG